MIPLYDNIPSRTTPVVNYLLIGICCFTFLQQVPDEDGLLILQYGMIPARVTAPRTPLQVERPVIVQQRLTTAVQMETVTIPPAAIPEWGTLLSCVFLHGGLWHLAGNMLFLYIFGDNVEDRLGHLGYLIFYLGCGVGASLAHYVSDTGSTIPTIGASGAVAGVMGAYLLLYPHAKVVSLVPIFFFLHLIVIPAPIFLGLWFLLQVLQGTFSIGRTQAAGVAWWAHVGGFVVGFLVARVLSRTGIIQHQVGDVRPGTQRSGVVRVASSRHRPPPI